MGIQSRSPTRASNEEAPAMGVARASDNHQTAKKGEITMNSSTLLQSNPVDSASMTSLEIAGLVESRHDKVKQSIERLAKRGVITSPPMGEKPTDGRPSTFYIFEGPQGKRDSLVVVAQLCPEFTARLVDRWQELEQRVAQPDPMQALRDPATMRGLLLSYSEKVLELESTVSEQAPKVDAFNRISNAEGSLCLTDAAKHLQMRPKDLINWMQAHDWIYKRAGGKNWIAYQPRLKQLVLAHKVTTITRDDGTEKTCEQVRVTPKGLARLAELVREAAA